MGEDEILIQKIPLSPIHNQEFLITLEINEENRTFRFAVNYNKTAGYWILKITDPSDESIIVDSIPLVAGTKGNYSLNFLRALEYLLIGEGLLIPIVSNPTSDFPNETNLAIDFEVVWSDNG